MDVRLLSGGILAALVLLHSPAAWSRDCAAIDRKRPPLPSTLDQKALQGYDRTLFTWLDSGAYHCLGWAKDKRVRDTGPYIAGKAYGTHPTVRIVYSPEVIAWMKNGRKGKIPDGAMIITVQSLPPAAKARSISASLMPS